jgi:hypothetical protein
LHLGISNSIIEIQNGHNFSFLSKVLGYVRDMAIAGYFGARYFTDAFFLAQVIPASGPAALHLHFPSLSFLYI